MMADHIPQRQLAMLKNQIYGEACFVNLKQSHNVRVFELLQSRGLMLNSVRVVWHALNVLDRYFNLGQGLHVHGYACL